MKGLAVILASVLLIILNNVVAVKISDCGSKSGKIISYSISPDEVTLPGVLNVSAAVDIFNDIERPVSIEVQLMKKVS